MQSKTVSLPPLQEPVDLLSAAHVASKAPFLRVKKNQVIVQLCLSFIREVRGQESTYAGYAGYRQTRAASGTRFLRVKLRTHWSDRCAVNERVVETVIPGHPMPSIQMTSALTERQAIKSLQERSLPRDAC